MIKLPCPACGAEIPFKSKVSVFAVCTYCRSTVVRHDLNLSTYGKMAELPEDMSLLQLGTQGIYSAESFELVGRLKLQWEHGMWDEWYAMFQDGKTGWLAEAQGFYCVTFPVAKATKLPERSDIQLGLKVGLGSQELEVDDIKDATCVGSEGELPMKGGQGRKSLSVDLSGPNGLFACLDYSDEGTKAYIGKYVEFDQMKLTNLREIDGW